MSSPIYDPSGDSWRTMVFQGAPHPRSEHSAVWTGSEMFVWGGTNYSPNAASYDPATGVWVGMSEKEAPSPRQRPTLIFLVGDGANGSGRMIVWGGGSQQNAATGEIYDIASDSWLPMAQFPLSVNEPNISAPSTTVWTGKEMITWDVGEGVGARYTP